MLILYQGLLRSAAGHSWPSQLSANPRCTVEEVYDAALQRILGSDDEEPIVLDQLFEDF
jgi:hypothetical protein